jgi:hypothetical protein
MVCDHFKPVLTRCTGDRGCRPDLQHRGRQRRWIQRNPAYRPESVAHSGSLSESEFDGSIGLRSRATGLDSGRGAGSSVV